MSRECPEDTISIELENGVITAVDNFMYLGNNIIKDGEVVNGKSVRLGKTARAFECL